jgi:DNA-binding NarL/FixJ family response regulator
MPGGARKEEGLTMQKTRVMIALSQTLFRQGLAALIGSDTDFEICGEAGDADETRRVCSRVHPELILLEAGFLNKGNECGTVACLRAACPEAAIVIIGGLGSDAQSEEETENELRMEKARALQQGAAAYLSAGVDQLELLRVLKTIAATLHCEEEEGAESARTVSKPTVTGHGRHSVTEREKTIITLIAQGMCNKEVAHRLGISTQTVKNHVSHLLEKLALADRTQLAVYAIEHHFEF